MRSRPSILMATTLMALSVIAVPHAGAETVAEVLESGKLKEAYNPVLLDYLLEEGRETLPEEQRKQAIDQLVSALKQDIDITPEEQRAAALAAAGAGLAQLFGGQDASDLGGAAQGATYQIWKGWVESAKTLQKAGYADQANAFFEKCIVIYPYSDLRGSCAIALAAGKPEEAYQRLMALTEDANSDAVKPALRLVGELAGSDGFPEATRGQAVERLTEFTGGMKKATYGVDACHGLVATKDPRAVATLQKLSTGMMNTDFHPCARRGLLLTFEDQSVAPMLEKQLGGGKFSTTEPWERMFAARLLIEAGNSAGYDWAREKLTEKQKKGGFKKLMSTSEEPDYRPGLVSTLVRVGGDRSLEVLRAGAAAVEPGSWLETWIALGMLELGDTSKIDLVRAALTNPEWEFTAVRATTALAKHDDLSGIPVLDALYQRAAQGLESEPGKAALAYLAGEGMQYESGRDAQKRRLLRLRWQIADAMATIDRPETAAVLEKMLGDNEPSVRASAAYALARMTTPEAAAGLAKAITVDYEASGERSRNPELHAHIVRRSAARFSDQEATASVVAAGAKSPYMSVRFLALCAQ